MPESIIDSVDFYKDKGLSPAFSKTCYDFFQEKAKSTSVILQFGCNYGDGITKALVWGLQQNTSKEKMVISVDIEDRITGTEREPKYSWWHFVLGNTIDKIEITEVEDLSYLDELPFWSQEIERTRAIRGEVDIPKKEEIKEYYSAKNQIESLLNGKKVNLLVLNLSSKSEEILSELETYSFYCDKKSIIAIIHNGGVDVLKPYIDTIKKYADDKKLTFEMISDFIIIIYVI